MPRHNLPKNFIDDLEKLLRKWESFASSSSPPPTDESRVDAPSMAEKALNSVPALS
jgi:hypothetical protein